MKRDTANCGYMLKLLTSQNQASRPGCLPLNIDVPTWKWEDVNVDFMVGLPCTCRQHDYILGHC